eukprot:CAMPEP_0195118008 /NCGR_PEP_ID=MMETSP0448-20130528/115851_1 /TAXON_ID=66468 /ORGANISM="Heterocapsa triquestra, Strain CCMP 448" /LENGTH=75 /DNA_ID=CAMNT_0040155259 /DNA_START=1 /DNA_END=225 /DNA_ORIENTATION=+
MVYTRVSDNGAALSEGDGPPCQPNARELVLSRWRASRVAALATAALALLAVAGGGFSMWRGGHASTSQVPVASPG